MRCLRQLTIQGTRNHGRRWEAVVTLDGVLSLFFFVFFGSHLRESEEKVQVNENLNKCCSVFYCFLLNTDHVGYMSS